MIYFPVKTEDSWQWPLLESGEETYPRLLAASAAITSPSERIRLVYFRARKTETIASVRSFSGSTAAVTPSLCKVGIYSVDQDTYAATLIASTANTTSLWIATNTEYTTALTASFVKRARAMYAFATLCVTIAVAPTLSGISLPAALSASGLRPVPAFGFVTGTDLPASIAFASVTTSFSGPYGALVP